MCLFWVTKQTFNINNLFPKKLAILEAQFRQYLEISPQIALALDMLFVNGP